MNGMKVVVALTIMIVLSLAFGERREIEYADNKDLSIGNPGIFRDSPRNDIPGFECPVDSHLCRPWFGKFNKVSDF